jgi:hypothetical protein
MGGLGLPMNYIRKTGKESLTMERIKKMEKKNKYYITYFSKSDGKKIERPYDPHHEMQHEFIAGNGNLCKRYWDESREGLRTANPPWTIRVRK